MKPRFVDGIVCPDNSDQAQGISGVVEEQKQHTNVEREGDTSHGCIVRRRARSSRANNLD